MTRLAASGKEIDLNKISTLLDVQLDILLLKISKLIKEGTLKGGIDKFSSLYYPMGLADSAQSSNNPIQQKTSQNSGGSSVQGSMQGFQKEAEVIKSETKETSQEDLVKFVVNVAYVGSNIRVGFKIINNSDFGISDVYIKLIHSDQLSLFRIKPKFDFDKISSGISIKLPKIREKSQLALNVYFKADTLGIGEIKGQFQYVNYQDFVRFIRIENLFYNLNPPKIVPKEIPTFEIEEFTKKEGIKRDIRSYGLPDNLNPNVAFNHISQIIKNFNFKLITKNEQPDQSIIWYFGETEDQEFSVLVVGQIINNKIEFYASSKNEQIISALLTAFSIDLKKRIINSHVVSSEEEIYDLYCDSCGGVLPYFPKPGEKVICKWCNNEVTVR